MNTNTSPFKVIFMSFKKRQKSLVSFLLIFLIGAVSAFSEEFEEHRFKNVIAAFEKDRVENQLPEEAVLCVGSSSMRMWDSRIKDDLYPLTVISRGFGGSQFSDVLYFFDELIIRYKPRAILIYEGDNDLSGGLTPGAVFEDFKEFQGRVHEFDPEIRIYVIGVKPSVVRWNLKDQIEETNRLLAAECDANPTLTYIDVSKFLLDDSGSPREGIFLDDGLHLNTVGYNLWAAAVGLQLIPAEIEFEDLVTQDLPE
ncbi:GDSL-type esterase/lipase family protein [Puniceicoccaceae bacterium K14]|nr:GDSL-type esterase/lipase family protein [Puniceicoccaceae bacterium K14]